MNKKVVRPQIGKTLRYRNSLIRIFHIGPDLISEVDNIELPNFYIDAEAARRAGKRHIDDMWKALDQAAAKA